MSARRTPYDDLYATCERTYAELRIYADLLDPEMISHSLALAPSSTQKKGQVFIGFHGKERTTNTGGWFLTSESEVDSKDLRRHLDWLIARIMPVVNQLRKLQDTPGIRMLVQCIWWSKHGDGGPTLWPEQMRALADLDLECGFDISFYGEGND